jgi:hypothetical protein
MDDHRPEAEARMRQSLGLSGGSKGTAAHDPQRVARQAIRSQAAAREYVERQLVRAEQTIHGLRTKFQAVRFERDAAVAAGQSARAAQIQAERSLRGLEAALAHEKTTNGRAQREAQEARASLHDLRAKLALADEAAKTLQSQLVQERQARISADQERSAGLAPVVGSRVESASGNQPPKLKRGRPPGKRDSSRPPQPAQRPKPYADNQQPVQWWTDGWKPIV